MAWCEENGVNYIFGLAGNLCRQPVLRAERVDVLGGDGNIPQIVDQGELERVVGADSSHSPVAPVSAPCGTRPPLASPAAATAWPARQ